MSAQPGCPRLRAGARLAGAVLVAALSLVQVACVTEQNGRPVAKQNPLPTDPNEIDRLARIHLELAGGYFSRGQTKDALDEVKQALAVKPDLAAGYDLRGLVYAAMDDTERADESFRKALQLAPHDGDIHHNLGWYLCQRGRYGEADAEFAQALAEPTYRGSSRTMLAQGVCQVRAGRLEDAEHTLSRAYELDPANPSTAVNLAEVLYRRGEYERALFYVRRVNTKDELVTAQTLWLAMRIEHKLGQEQQVQDTGARLRQKFPQSREALLFEKGRFDE
jgi:type IV pilus assembly protein PilF